MELTICEHWNMSVSEPEEKWFLDYVLRSPRDAGIHLTAGWHAYQALADIEVETALEYFGGMGAQSLMIQNIFRPSLLHVAYDNSPEAVAHMAQAVDVFSYVPLCVDSYNPEKYQPADLVGLDFGDLTVWKTRDDEPHRQLMNRVFQIGKPKAVVLTDVACRYLHLHRKRYETLLGPGTCVDYPTYLEALADRLEILYGYRVVAGFWHRWSTVMALVPGYSETDAPRFIPTPESPVGLEIKR